MSLYRIVTSILSDHTVGSVTLEIPKEKKISYLQNGEMIPLSNTMYR